ncbi:DNA repair protein RecO [Legionella israelensis]|uniref:DNA repair protein RecO n=1 Tax=Legionella israelensis TaxID=454 RepID=A0A0W0VUH5_9GAMM|nr:DNA repair protein RecO C-terminal domain-containing protein [Legionella israelensis]KTD23706.1 DNA repair protein recO [Legionella israelensis]QBS10914.1 DNA repair protein RecO [Legionella israelensis]QDP72875.1 DNA repair protein RecO [Legionella israelensis]SCX80016.1 DNA replication and repair protein RecO [Legionella israelensis DSM 19235]STX57902.1 DNA repair protein RecO (recombination protein O) [Legionella israelensis]
MLNGWLLFKRASGDSSVQATFFTREQGVISCLCKGWRAAKKKSILQAFVPLWLSIDERREWYYARRIEFSGPILELQGQALFSGLYVNELLYHALKPLDPAIKLYDAYQQTLMSLTCIQDKMALEAVLRRFEWILLEACGYAVSFAEEAGTLKAIKPGSFYQYVAGEGFYPAAQGIDGSYLLALAENNLECAETLRIAKYIMRKAISHLFDGREIKSRALFQS